MRPEVFEKFHVKIDQFMMDSYGAFKGMFDPMEEEVSSMDGSDGDSEGIFEDDSDFFEEFDEEGWSDL